MTIRLRKVLPERDWTPAYWVVSQDRELSFKALGVHTYLMSLPPDWKISADAIARGSREGRDAIQGALRELTAAGLYQVVRERQPGGTFNTYGVIHAIPRDMTTDENTPENPPLWDDELSNEDEKWPDNPQVSESKVPDNPQVSPERENPPPVPVSEVAGNPASFKTKDADSPARDNPAIEKRDFKKKKNPSQSSGAGRDETDPVERAAQAICDVWWLSYGKGNAQSFIAVKKIVMTAVANDVEVAELTTALNHLGRQRKPVTAASLQFALGQPQGLPANAAPGRGGFVGDLPMWER